VTHFPKRKFDIAVHLTEAEREALREAFGHQAIFARGQDLVRQGDRPVSATVLLEGLACRHKTLKGGKRQISAFEIAGDWPDLQSYFVRCMDQSITAITECRAAVIPHAQLHALCEAHPRITLLLWRETMIQAGIFREWVVNLGARDAVSRTAHLICELQIRLQMVALASREQFLFPVNQTELAESVGVSAVHMNRVLQELKRDDLVHFARGIIDIPDLDRLRAACDFDPDYLHLSSDAPDGQVRMDWTGLSPSRVRLVPLEGLQSAPAWDASARASRLPR
jgi:CRP-like cAMP-binding protein